MQWTTLVEAELASLDGQTTAAFRLYDLAVKYAREGEWASDEGWALYLSGSNFIRCGVEGFGLELQQRGVQVHSRWGAFGIVNFLSQEMGGLNNDSTPGRHLVEVSQAILQIRDMSSLSTDLMIRILLLLVHRWESRPTEPSWPLSNPPGHR